MTVNRTESALNLRLMRLIDEEYTRAPFYGYRKMAARFQVRGYHVNRKRVARLMRKMGLFAIYPGPHIDFGPTAQEIPLSTPRVGDHPA